MFKREKGKEYKRNDEKKYKEIIDFFSPYFYGDLEFNAENKLKCMFLIYKGTFLTKTHRIFWKIKDHPNLKELEMNFYKIFE